MAILVIASCSAEASPPLPLDWFIVHFELEDHNSPDGINFFIERQDPDLCFDNSDLISITNETNIPIYLESESQWMESHRDYEPCPTEDLCLKVVSNRAWEWAYISNAEGTKWYYDWEIIESYHGLKMLSLSPSYNGLMPIGSSYYLDLFENNNVSGYGGDRPVDVIVPDQQKFNLPYIYENEEFSVEVTVIYSLNECYPSEAFYNPHGPSYWEKQVFGCIVFVIVSLLLVVVIYNLSAIRSDRKDAS